MKTILPLFFMLFSISANSYNIKINENFSDSIPCDNTTNDSINNFINYMEEFNYDKAKTYESALLNNIDSLYLYEKLALMDFYIGTKKYETCISYCDYFTLQNPDIYENLSSTYGECYYFLHDPNKAYEHFKTYINLCNKNDLAIGKYYMRIIAYTLKNLHKYEEADIYFDKYLKEIMNDENLNINNIYTSKNKEYIGYFLYKYAYNKIFQGDEISGLKFLKLAAYCGDEYANEDYNILSKSSTFAQNLQLKKKYIKKFNSILEKYDIYKNLPNEQTIFWDSIEYKNEELQKLTVALKKSKKPGTLKRALNTFDEPELEMDLYRLRPYEITDTEKELRKDICGYQDFLKDLRIFPDGSKNAFTTPFGHIYITTSLISSYHFNHDLLLAICAHEATHYLCQHTLINAWKYEKRKKTNNIIAGVSSGLVATASTISGAYVSTYMTEEDREKYMEDINQSNVDLINSSFEQARISSLLYKYRYSRNQELEADIVAYRFCESIGIGGYVYITALQLLGDQSAYMKADKDSDHPTTAFRVCLLKYLYDKEHNINQTVM